MLSRTKDHTEKLNLEPSDEKYEPEEGTEIKSQAETGHWAEHNPLYPARNKLTDPHVHGTQGES